MKTILISAGHGGTDPGAVGNGYKEAVLALKLRDRVYDGLKQRNIPCQRDGDDGVNEPLSKAIGLCRAADIAVEIHFNAGSPSATGIEALCKPAQKKLAQDLCQSIAQLTGIKPRGDKGWKADNSGQHHRLGFCEAGGIILEVCFISNSDDMKRYVDNKHSVAIALANVLAGYATRGEMLNAKLRRPPDDDG